MSPAEHIAVPTRSQIRTVATEMGAAMHAAARTGSNPHHVRLDYNDRADVFAAAIAATHGRDAALTFLRIWEEEAFAASVHVPPPAPSPALPAPTPEARAADNETLVFRLLAAVAACVVLFFLVTHCAGG